jgi:acetoin utilization deacetylase AcuC-like enzyme
MTGRRLPVVTSDGYEIDIGPHVFPTRKYRLVRERLLAEGTIGAADLVEPKPATDSQIRLAHTAGYVGKMFLDGFSEYERMQLEIPYNDTIRAAAWLCASGSIEAGSLARRHGVAIHLGGGFHHAFADHGEGFCLVNDVAVAIRALQRSGEIARASVIDLDVHHGNGTAAIFAGDADVFTFSMHQEHNYPAKKPRGSLDVGLADGTGDAEYLARLRECLPAAIEGHQPELIFYLAGADPFRHDQLGGLGLTFGGLRDRDAFVLDAARRAGVPVAVVLAGGYAKEPDDTVEIHCTTVRVARESLWLGRGCG